MEPQLLVGTRGGPRGRAGLVLDLVNDERRSKGLHTLRRGDRATKAAAIRARYLARTEVLSHTAGLGWEEVIRQVGLAGKAAAENIAMGYRDPDDVVRAWMESAGHRRNILDPDYRVLGVAAAIDDDDDTFWCQIFTS